MDEPVAATEDTPVPAPHSSLQSLRARLGSMNCLSQREVDQLIARLRSKRRQTSG